MVRGTRQIVWTKQSKIDKRDIFSYWNQRNKSTIYSRKLAKLFDLKMKSIAENIFMGRKTSIENIFSVVVRDCIIIYEFFPKKIVVYRVWEGHQNPENLSV